jgi:hypothetical protein
MPLGARRRRAGDARRGLGAHRGDVPARRAETRLGRVEDKRIKNRAAITKTPGPEFLEPVAASGDDGLMVMERAPYGVIASITPVHQPHRDHHQQRHRHGGRRQRGGVQHPPRGQGDERLVRLAALRRHRERGRPREPALLHRRAHRAERAGAHASQGRAHRGGDGRRRGGAGGHALGQAGHQRGPGQPPRGGRRDRDLDAAARGIVAGASFDNNIICTCEKEIVVVAGGRQVQEGAEGARRRTSSTRASCGSSRRCSSPPTTT